MTRHIVVAIGLVAALPAWAARPVQRTFYVSPHGRDTWSGLLDRPNAAGTDGPFASLTRARDAMRSGAVKTTQVREGRYAISATVTLGSPDRGETWAAYPGEHPILSGGSVVHGWRAEDGGVFSAASGKPGLDLTVGGVRQRAADRGFDPMQSNITGWRPALAPSGFDDKRGTRFAFRPSDVSTAEAGSYVALQFFGADRYEDLITTIKSVSFSPPVLTMGDAAPLGLAPGATFRVLGSPADLHNTGEFAWRAPDRRILLKPLDPARFERDGVVVARLSAIFADNGGDGITFLGLSFQDTIGTGLVASGDAAIRVDNADHVIVAEDIFTNVGTAVALHGTTNTTISDNAISSSGYHGIIVQNATTTLVQRNRMRDVGVIQKLLVAGVSVLDSRATRISGNVVDYSAQRGISVSDYGSNALNTTDTIVEDNQIFHLCRESADAGGIYFFYGLQTGQRNSRTVVRRNRVEDFGGVISDEAGNIVPSNSALGIYLDDRTSGVQVTGNLTVGGPDAALYSHGGANVAFEGNVAVLPTPVVALGRDGRWAPATPDLPRGGIIRFRVLPALFPMDKRTSTLVIQASSVSAAGGSSRVAVLADGKQVGTVLLGPALAGKAVQVALAPGQRHVIELRGEVGYTRVRALYVNGSPIDPNSSAVTAYFLQLQSSDYPPPNLPPVGVTVTGNIAAADGPIWDQVATYDIPPRNLIIDRDDLLNIRRAMVPGSPGLDAHSIVADPRFRDPGRGDYHLRLDSPAFGIGFVDPHWSW